MVITHSRKYIVIKIMISITSTLVRAVKETDLKSVGLCPRRFKSYSVRASLAQLVRAFAS